MCVCVYVCVCVTCRQEAEPHPETIVEDTYTCVHKRMLDYTFARTCAHKGAQSNICVHVQIKNCVHVQIETCVHVQIETCVHVQIVDGLVSCEAPSLESFEWLCHVRHYWDIETDVLYVAFAQVCVCAYVRMCVHMCLSVCVCVCVCVGAYVCAYVFECVQCVICGQIGLPAPSCPCTCLHDHGADVAGFLLSSSSFLANFSCTSARTLLNHY